MKVCLVFLFWFPSLYCIFPFVCGMLCILLCFPSAVKPVHSSWGPTQLAGRTAAGSPGFHFNTGDHYQTHLFRPAEMFPSFTLEVQTFTPSKLLECTVDVNVIPSLETVKWNSRKQRFVMFISHVILLSSTLNECMMFFQNSYLTGPSKPKCQASKKTHLFSKKNMDSK